MSRVVVVGAGMVGAACAYYAARAGLDVLVLDRFVMYKPDQKPLTDDIDWKKQFALD